MPINPTPRFGWVALMGAAVASTVLAAVVALPTSVAHAARALSLTVLTPVPQVHGEITLAGVLGGGSSTAGVDVTIERYVSGGWVVVANATTDPNGEFLSTRPADSAGSTYFRAKAPAAGSEPALFSPVVGSYVFGEAEQKFESTSIPTVTGAPIIGSTLRAEPGAWAPQANYFTYRWNRDGVSTGITTRDYVLSGADLGRHITVTVVGWRSGTMTLRDSRPTTRVVRGTFATQPPEIVGRAVVGESLRAVVSGWKPTPDKLEYQWRRNETTITGATGDRYTVTADDAGAALSVVVHATASGVDGAQATSAAFAVPAKATRPQRTFGDLIAPLTTEPWTSAGLSFTSSAQAPAWGALTRTRWDKAGAFTHAQHPKPLGTLVSAMFDRPWTRPAEGAEYPGTNPSFKNADVTFTINARRFAIVYRGNAKSDAMVWVDDKPIAATPINGVGAGDAAVENWISVTLPTKRTAKVRFAGPLSFTGVDVPQAEPATITATTPRFTLGVLSDSFYEVCSEPRCMSRSGAPILSTLTGFRVWNMSESASGYLSKGIYGFPGFQPSPFGSTQRLNGVLDAPIDALLIGGSMNDALQSLDDHRPAVDKLLRDLADTRPDLPVVLLGIEPLSGPYKSPWWINRGNALTANLRAMVGRHQNVVGFIDPFTDPWITGTGSLGNPKGDGNADQYFGTDGIHPGVAGTQYYQQRIVDGLRSLPLPAPQ